MSSQKSTPHFRRVSAALLAGPFGPPLRFEVRAGGAVWRFDVAFDGHRPALHHPELVDDGEPPGHVRAGGHIPSPPVAEAQLAVEDEMRRLWEDDVARLSMTSAGFPGPPIERKSTAGRPRTDSDALLAVRARRALDQLQRAPQEKLLTQARRRGVLQGRPRPDEFTLYGALLLRQSDRAKGRLLELLDGSGRPVDVETFAPAIPGPPDAKRAAIEDLLGDGEIRVVRHARPEERKRHGYAEAELVRR